MASVFILEMRILRQKDTQLQTGAEARLVCNTQTKTMSEGEGSKTLRKEGETVSGSIFLDPVPRGYGLRLRTSREEDEMTISNTPHRPFGATPDYFDY